MSETPFVNRKEDLSEILELLNAPRENPLSVFVAAASGVGKSRLLDEISARYEGCSLIRVRIRRSRGSRLENGFFLIQIAAALHRAAEDIEGIPSLTDFNKNLKAHLADDNFGLETIDELLKELDIPLVRQIKSLFERRYSRGNFKPRELLGVNEQAAVAYLKRYIRAVLEHQTIGLIFENMHLVDEDTLAFLVETVEWPNDALLMCEITNIDAASSANFWSFGELAEEFDRAGFEIRTKLLAPLTYDHYTEVARNKGVVEDTRLKDAYQNEAGNIRAIYNVAAIEERGVMAGAGVDSFEQLFNSLKRDEKFLAVALHVHDAAVPSDLMGAFITQVTDHGIDKSLLQQAKSELALSELINLDNGTVSLAHDSLARALDTLAPPAMRHLSQRIWIDVYGNIEKANDQWLFYFQLAIDHGDESLLLNALDRIETIAGGSHFRDRVIEVLTAAAATFISMIETDAEALGRTGLRRIAQTLFELEAYTDVETLVPHLRLDEANDQLLRAALASRLDQLDATLDLTSPDATLGYDDEVGFAVIRLSALATTHLRKEALALYRHTAAKPGTTQSRYFPYLLRNTDIFLTHTDSLEPIRRSAEIFAARGDGLEEAHSRNALGMQLGRLGKLDEARHQIKQAEELMASESSGHAQTINNRAVLRASDTRYDEGTRMLLHLARDAVQFPFDRLVVSQNLAALSALAGDNDIEAQFEASGQLLDGLALNNQGLRRSHLWNYAQWASTAGKPDLATALVEEARGLDMNHTDLWKFRLFGTPQPDVEFCFLAEQSFHFSYLSKWHFSLDLV